jgi:two-component system OmpR family response regulator
MIGPSRILLVDDHADIREALTDYLQRYDMQVETAENGAAMRQVLQQERFDLILLDVKMPGEDGLSLCRYVYEHLRIPVILLTGMADAVDRIAGLELGADDYITKPFDPRELVARIRSLFRRISTISAPAVQPLMKRDYYQFDQWLLDIEGQILVSMDGESVELSRMEYRLLRTLLENPRKVFSRERLISMINSSDNGVFDRSVDSQISRLRKKMHDSGRHPRLLRTIWGDGYLLDASVQQVSL